MWGLPPPGIEPMSFAVADGFFATEPAVKPRTLTFELPKLHNKQVVKWSVNPGLFDSKTITTIFCTPLLWKKRCLISFEVSILTWVPSLQISDFYKIFQSPPSWNLSQFSLYLLPLWCVTDNWESFLGSTAHWPLFLAVITTNHTYVTSPEPTLAFYLCQPLCSAELLT